MSVSLKESYDIAYDGSENAARMDLFIDTSADLAGLTHFDSIKLLQGSTAEDISTGDKYMMQTGGTWVLQPSGNVFQNVYTKAEVDNMYNTLYQTMLYYHTTLTSTDGTITFYAFSGFIASMIIYGNGQQTGTPTPDNPVMPTFCGVRTGNLFDKNKTPSQIYVTDSVQSLGIEIPLIAGTYTARGGTGTSYAKTKINGVYGEAISLSYARQFTLDSDGYILVYAGTQEFYDAAKNTIIINAGSTALPYEPFGYKIPLTCAGQTVPVYLGQVSTVRRIKKLELKGTEGWQLYSGNYYSSVVDRDSRQAQMCICTHLASTSTSGIYVDSGSSRLKVFSASVSDVAQSLAEWKTFLADEYAAGHPVTIWYRLAESKWEIAIVNEPLAKIGDYADELLLNDTLAPIPTTDGENTLTVDTVLPPSLIEISGER